MKVGIVKDAIYLEHVTDEYHPESPRRLESIYGMLEELDQKDLVYIKPRMASHEELALVHEPSYITMVAGTKGKSQRLDPDTVASPRSYDAACMAAGGSLQLIDALFAGEVHRGFSLVRPPGHHAESARAMGFCIFNNIAIGARYLEQKYGLTRILIVDWDLHHGNGTQHAFYRDATIMYMSTHQYPYYPGTGWFDEIGEGPGKGYTVNAPMSPGMKDDDYVHIFTELFMPIARLFKPQIVLVSAGFDTHHRDPLGGMAVTEKGFANMAHLLIDIADSEAKGKIVFVLEGGYDLTGLTNSVKSVITELKGPACESNLAPAPSQAARHIVERSKQAIKPVWDF